VVDRLATRAANGPMMTHAERIGQFRQIIRTRLATAQVGGLHRAIRLWHDRCKSANMREQIRRS
jgi:hypothetical protein